MQTRQLFINGQETVNDDMSQNMLTTNGSTNETIVKLDEQRMYYMDSEGCEPFCKDTLNTMQRYLQPLFCQVKFLSDSKSQFNEPNFVSRGRINSVTGNREVQQTAQICTFLLDNLCKLNCVCYL
jgi:hypothetical protein